jgi:hypothetical protein
LPIPGSPVINAGIIQQLNIAPVQPPILFAPAPVLALLPVPPVPGHTVALPAAVQIDEGIEDEDIVEEVDEVDGNGKRSRKTRKFTFWNFVEKIDATNSYCKCGCLDSDGLSRKKYSTPFSGAIKRHVEKIHPQLYSLFLNCKQNRGNINELTESIAKLDGESVAKAAKRRRRSDSFFSKAVGLEMAVTSDLRLLLWAVTNGISRNALNDPLFDAYLKSLGSQLASNRHTLQDQYLPALDDLVVDTMSSELKEVKCIALSSDGWRDRARRDWINIVLSWISTSRLNLKKWEIFSVEPDLIYLPSSATADTIAYLINDSLESVVPPLVL